MKAGLFYNKENVGDVLICKIKDLMATSSKAFDNGVVAIYNKEEVIGYNFLNISKDFALNIKGVIYHPANELVDYLNNKLLENNLEQIEILKDDFRVGKVVECEDIEGTHLHLCQVDIKDEVLQIVCGAYNCKKDIKVVVAMVGCLMNNGEVITKGSLQGYESSGMLCSKRELNIKTDELRGLLILDDSYLVGSKFDVE